MDDIRLALIGTGQNMIGHLRSLVHIDGVHIAGIADVDPERMALAQQQVEHDVPAYLDYRDLLGEVEADAVFIAVPNYLHRQVTCDCLDAGLHVMCEKPMATSVADCDAMIAAAERNERILQVGLSCRFSRVDSKACELVAAGEIGEPVMVWAREFRAPFAKKFQDWILDDKRSGGTLLEKTCHHFDLFNWFAGAGPQGAANPTRVYASGGADWVYADIARLPEGRTEAEAPTVNILDNAFVTVDYDTGARANLALCMFADHGRKLEIGIQGTHGTVVYYRLEFRVELYNADHRGEASVIDIEIPDQEMHWSHHGQAYLEQLYFFDCVREGRRPEVDGYVGKRAVEISLAAERSAKTHAPVEYEATRLPG